MNEIYIELLQKYAGFLISIIINVIIWIIKPYSFQPIVLSILFILFIGIYQWAMSAYGHNVSVPSILAIQGATMAFLPLLKMIELRWYEYRANDNIFKMASELKDWQKALLLVMLFGGLPWALFSISTLVVYIFSLVAFFFFTHYMHQLDQVLKKKQRNT